MSAVFGNSAKPLWWRSRGGVQRCRKWVLECGGLTPALFPMFPELQDDTYATVADGPSFFVVGQCSRPSNGLRRCPTRCRHFSRRMEMTSVPTQNWHGVVVLNDASTPFLTNPCGS